MRTEENMVTLEKLRLREVALNSLLAKMGKDLRVKATEVRKNNVQKPAFGIGIAGASLQIRCYPTPEDMAMSDLELLNELAKKFQEATSGVAVVDMLPSREELIAHLIRHRYARCRRCIRLPVQPKAPWQGQHAQTMQVPPASHPALQR